MQVNSTQYLAIFQKICDSQVNTSYTRGEVDLLLRVMEDKLRMESQLTVNQSINAINASVNELEETLGNEMNSELNTSIAAIKKDLDVLKAVQGLQDITKTAADISAFKGKLQDFSDRLDKMDSKMEDTRSQLQTLLSKENTSSALIAPISQAVQTAQSDPNWPWYILTLICVIGVGSLAFHKQIEGQIKKVTGPEKTTTATRLHVTTDDWEEIMKENDDLARQAAKVREAGIKNIQETVEGIENKKEEEDKKTWLKQKPKK